MDLRKPKRKRRPWTHPEKKDKRRAGKPRYNWQELFTTFNGDKREWDDVFKGSEENIPAQNSTFSENIVKKKRIKAFSNVWKHKELFIHRHNEGIWEEVPRGAGNTPWKITKNKGLGVVVHTCYPQLRIVRCGPTLAHSDLKPLK